MRQVLCLIMAALVLCGAAAAKSAGTTGFELFRTDGFARSSALAGSQIAVGGDLHSLFTNPAGLGEITVPSGSIGYFKHVLDINSGNLAYARPVNKVGTLGIGITYFDYGKFDKADENGQKLGDFRASDILLTGAIGRKLADDLHGGVSVKFLNSNIDGNTASALAADVGVIYHTGYLGWDIGAGVANLGFATSAYLTNKDELPTAYRLGMSVPLEHLPVRFSALGEFTNAEGIMGAGGLEFTFSPVIQARIGYSSVGIDQRVGLSSDALAGFSAGLGLHIKRISFDYALTSQGEVGFLNRFTISAPLR